MSEATWTAVVIVFINMVGSVILTFMRYYYRAKYGIGEWSNDGKKNGNGKHQQEPMP